MRIIPLIQVCQIKFWLLKNAPQGFDALQELNAVTFVK